MGCVFCDIASGAARASVIHDDGGALAFLDKYPVDRGHSLLIPRAHYATISEMPPGEVGPLFSRVPRLARAILAASGAAAFSLGQNNGRPAGQIIDHVHVHIIPRYAGRGAVWTGRRIAGRGELDELAEGIRSELSRTGRGCT